MTEKLFDHEAVARYAAASGDDNPIHLDDEAARQAGLDGAIAQGMLVLGWAVGQLAVPEDRYTLNARFVAPVPVGQVATLVGEKSGQARVVREDGGDAVVLEYSSDLAPDRLTAPQGAITVAEVAVSPSEAAMARLGRAVDAGSGVPTFPFVLTAVGFLPDDPVNAGLRRPYPVTDCQDWVGSTRPALHGEQVITVARPFVSGERLLARTVRLSRVRRPRARGGHLAFTALRTVFVDEGQTVIAASEMNLIVVEDE